jgi:biotin carboxyl carrier protein
MKMELPVTAPMDGVVRSCVAARGRRSLVAQTLVVLRAGDDVAVA